MRHGMDPNPSSKTNEYSKLVSRVNALNDGDDYAAVHALIEKQVRECPTILQELRMNNKKTTHWAWWVFPNERMGANEPTPKTCVTPQTAETLLHRAPLTWRECLEDIVLLVQIEERTLKESRMSENARRTIALAKIFPEQADHGRIQGFVTFWKTQSCTPQWLRDICDSLDIRITK